MIVGRSPSGDRVTHDPMPRDVEPAPAPLSQSDIRKLLQGMVHDPDAPTSVAIEAFTATAASLYTWCVPSDVDAALGGMNTIQQISPSSERQSHASN